jgi:uncharacterized protein
MIEAAADEWPINAVDVRSLELAGWRPVPVREFVVKLVGNCNLACDYCYVYEMADRTWLARPPTMPTATLVRACERLAEHVERHGLARVRVVLHGGEPLLAGPDAIASAAATVRRHVPSGVDLDLRVQTNGVLLNERMLHVLRVHGVRVGVSLDGPAASHDRHRVLVTLRDR